MSELTCRIIIEVKIQDPEERKISQTEWVRKYGFAFCGKTVLVGKEDTVI